MILLRRQSIVERFVAALVVLVSTTIATGEQPLAEKRETPVQFDKEVLPILSKHCLACHNATKAESNLVLENPQTILKGGDSGPAVVPLKSSESLLVKFASREAERAMPPEGNTVGATPLAPEEFALIKLWIDQGATGSVVQQAGPVPWQSLSPGVQPVYSVAVNADGQLAACGRANQVFIYHLPSGRLITRLADPNVSKSGLYKDQRIAHLDYVQSLAFSPDGELLASGAYREVKLWRRPHNERKMQFTAGEPPQAVAINPAGNSIATGNAKGTITQWDLSGKATKTLTGHSGPIIGLRFLDAEKLVSASLDKSIRFWNVSTGAAIGQIDTPAPITALAVLSDGQRVAAGTQDKLVRIWAIPTTPAPAATPPVMTLTGHGGSITAVVASPNDPNSLFSASDDRTIRQWNLKDGKQIRQIDHGGPVAAIAIRPDGQQVASVGGNNLIRLWNASNGQPWTAKDNRPIGELKGDGRSRFRIAASEQQVALAAMKLELAKTAKAEIEKRITSLNETAKTAPTNESTATKTAAEKDTAAQAAVAAKATADKDLESATSAAKTAQEKAAQAKTAAEKEPQNTELAKARDEASKAAEEAEKNRTASETKARDAEKTATKANNELMTAQRAIKNIQQQTIETAKAIKDAENSLPTAQAEIVTMEKSVADAKASLQQVQQQTATLEKPFRSLAYSADGSQLAAAGENQIVQLFSSENGSLLDAFDGHPAVVTALAFSSTGDLLSTSTDKTCILWNTNPDWKLERTIGNADDPSLLIGRVLALGFSPDGRLLATGGGEPSRSGELKLWNVADGKLLRAISPSHSDTVFGLEFSPDGTKLASGGADRFMKVFDVNAGTLVRAFEGHTHHVLDVAWRADGQVLATAGADNVIKFWDFAAGTQQRTTPPVGKEITSLAFVALSHRLIASSGDSNVRLYNADNGNVDRNYGGARDFLHATTVAADGKTLVAGGQDGTLYSWDVDTGQQLRTLAAPSAP